MKVLVTGASGFIGSHVVASLVQARHTVTALSRLSGSRPAGDRIRNAVGDLTVVASLAEACRGQDCVIHAAGLVDDAATRRLYETVVVQGTANVISAASRAGVPRMIHVSSIAVYDTRQRTLTEATPLARDGPAWNHYARAKIASEDLLWEAHRAGRIGVTVLRPSITLGPGDRFTAPRMRRLLCSRLAALVGRADNPVPCVVVEELAAALTRAAESRTSEGRAYNVSGHAPISQYEFFGLFAQAFGLPMPTWRLPRRAAGVAGAALETWWRIAVAGRRPPLTRFTVWAASTPCEVDTTRAAADLGWRGEASYADAIRRSVQWLKEVSPCAS